MKLEVGDLCFDTTCTLGVIESFEVRDGEIWAVGKNLIDDNPWDSTDPVLFLDRQTAEKLWQSFGGVVKRFVELAEQMQCAKLSGGELKDGFISKKETSPLMHPGEVVLRKRILRTEDIDDEYTGLPELPGKPR